MDTSVCLAQDPIARCYTLAPAVSVQWETDVIYCGFRAAYKISLSGVFGTTKIVIFCRTGDGELLDDNMSQMSSFSYRGKVLIPYNVKAGTKVTVEIVLPELGISCTSIGRPVHTSIPATAAYVTDETCEMALEEVRAEVARYESSSGCLHSGSYERKRFLPLRISNRMQSIMSRFLKKRPFKPFFTVFPAHLRRFSASLQYRSN